MVVLAGEQAITIEAGGEIAVGDDVRAAVAAALGLRDDRIGACNVVDVAVGIDDRLNGRLGVIRAQAGEYGRREALLCGIDDQHALLADKGNGVAEGREEGRSVGDDLGLAEVKEGGLLRREIAGRAEIEALGLYRLGHRAAPI